jgi:hypothetical protein
MFINSVLLDETPAQHDRQLTVSNTLFLLLLLYVYIANEKINVEQCSFNKIYLLLSMLVRYFPTYVQQLLIFLYIDI